MGKGYKYHCPKCGYKFSAYIGTGFLFPQEYAENVEKAKAGKFGAKLKKLFADHPDAALDIEPVVMRCNDCGRYYTRARMDGYLPKEKAEGKPKEDHGRWSVAFPFEGTDYVTSSDLEESYRKVLPHNYKCRYCHGHLSEVPKDDLLSLGKMVCPKCGEALEPEKMILWD